MKLDNDPEVEKFRAEFTAFLDEHTPRPEEATEPSTSSAHMPEWTRRWQRMLFDHGWLLPGQPPQYGGRNATLPQLLAHQEELSRRRIYHSFNPQGVRDHRGLDLVVRDRGAEADVGRPHAAGRA